MSFQTEIYDAAHSGELISFTAKVNNGDVELSWIKVADTYNQGFEVERRDANGDFEKLGFVVVYGNTNEPKAYSYTDSKLSAGSYTYRLKQIDYDDTYEYSDEITVEFTTPN